MLSYIAHYKNKYPGGKVFCSESQLDVYDAQGDHVVSMAKNGAGQWACVSDRVGARDQHDLSPIPKDCRAWKHHAAKDGKKERIDQSEEFAARSKVASAMAVDGKILSCDEYSAQGWQFEKDQSVKSAPSPKQA